MRRYYSFVKTTVQTKSKKKISFSVDKLADYAECVNISLVDDVDCVADKMLACTSVNELCKLIINSVDLQEVTRSLGYDVEIIDIIQDKINKFSEKMQAINSMSEISSITIAEETETTGEYAVTIAPQWCYEKLSKDIIEEACGSSKEFVRITDMIDGGELAVFNASIVTTVYFDGSKTKAKWRIDGETAYGQDGFALKNELTVKKAAVKVETWDLFDNIDKNDSRWIKWSNWAMKELTEYNKRLMMEIDLDFATFSKMMSSVPQGSKYRKLMLDYPYVYLKVQEGDELACRFASIYCEIF